MALASRRKRSVQAAVGRLAFNDASLSASGKLSCASCHAIDDVIAFLQTLSDGWRPR